VLSLYLILEILRKELVSFTEKDHYLREPYGLNGKERSETELFFYLRPSGVRAPGRKALRFYERITLAF
jgi:hypothetical protein